MIPTPKKPVAPPPATKPEDAPPPEDADFAEEGAPKETEFGEKKDARALTAGEFDPIP